MLLHFVLFKLKLWLYLMHFIYNDEIMGILWIFKIYIEEYSQLNKYNHEIAILYDKIFLLVKTNEHLTMDKCSMPYWNIFFNSSKKICMDHHETLGSAWHSLWTTVYACCSYLSFNYWTEILIFEWSWVKHYKLNTLFSCAKITLL